MSSREAASARLSMHMAPSLLAQAAQYELSSVRRTARRPGHLATTLTYSVSSDQQQASRHTGNPSVRATDHPSATAWTSAAIASNNVGGYVPTCLTRDFA